MGDRLVVTINGVDPRACGVDNNDTPNICHAMGGSPRMRGRLDQEITDRGVRRWIPAHAG